MMPTRKSQRQKILDLLVGTREWVPAPALAAISLQYSSRVLELRRMGFRITNRTEMIGGIRHGFFRIETGMPGARAQRPAAATAANEPREYLVDVSPEPSYPG